jgi:hypothetical protein
MLKEPKRDQDNTVRELTIDELESIAGSGVVSAAAGVVAAGAGASTLENSTQFYFLLLSVF